LVISYRALPQRTRPSTCGICDVVIVSAWTHGVLALVSPRPGGDQHRNVRPGPGMSSSVPVNGVPSVLGGSTRCADAELASTTPTYAAAATSAAQATVRVARI
jgi:hypothetical protein